MTKLALVVLLALAGTAGADTKVDKELKLQMDVPAGWKVTVAGDTTAYDHPSNEVSVLVIRTTQTDTQQAMADLGKRLGGIVTDVKQLGSAERKKLNGLDAVLVKATGQVGGKACDIVFLLITAPTGKIGIVVGIMEEAKRDQHAVEVQKLVSSIKPVK
jgi:hypothetical protein